MKWNNTVLLSWGQALLGINYFTFSVFTPLCIESTRSSYKTLREIRLYIRTTNQSCRSNAPGHCLKCASGTRHRRCFPYLSIWVRASVLELEAEEEGAVVTHLSCPPCPPFRLRKTLFLLLAIRSRRPLGPCRYYQFDFRYILVPFFFLRGCWRPVGFEVQWLSPILSFGKIRIISSLFCCIWCQFKRTDLIWKSVARFFLRRIWMSEFDQFLWPSLLSLSHKQSVKLLFFLLISHFIWIFACLSCSISVWSLNYS